MIKPTNQLNHAQGFTLMELLIVVVIVAILAVAGVNLINSQSTERLLQDEGQKLMARLNQLCERSILENRAHGVEWGEEGVQALRFGAGSWQALEQQWQSDFVESIRLNGIDINTQQAWEQQPHVICQADGSLNAFEWRIQAEDLPQVAYQVTTADPWQLSGKWHEIQ